MSEKEIWIVADHRDGEMREITLEMLREGRMLADNAKLKLCAVLLGHNVQNIAEILGQHGADRVYLSCHPSLEHYSTDGYTAVLADLIKNNDPQLVMIGATPYGKDLASCLASRLQVPLLSGCVKLKLNSDGLIEGIRPAYSGKVYTSVCSIGGFCIATIRPGVIGADHPKKSRKAEVVEVLANIEPASIRTKVVGFIKADPAKIDITEADLIICGGKGVGSQENWEMINQLAEVLGASVGATKLAMDAGWTSRERMVGVSGRYIAPRCYIAAGVSGASAHTSGIKDSRLIIALNEDRQAPIFKMADMSVIGDIHRIIPCLIKQLNSMVKQAGAGEVV